MTAFEKQVRKEKQEAWARIAQQIGAGGKLLGKGK